MKHLFILLLLFASANGLGWFSEYEQWGCALVNYEGEYRIAVYTDLLIGGEEWTFVEDGIDEDRQLIWRRVDLPEEAFMHELKGCPVPNLE